MPAHHGFVKAIAPALRHRCGVKAGASIMVAVSGGGDSVALLRALAAIAPRRRWRLQLVVAHVQHHLRGATAEQDADFTRRLAHQLDLPFVRRDLDIAAQQANLEARARQARYAALCQLAQQHGATFVATAHHGDDQLETLLMRLLRGSSVRGLAAMAWNRRLAPGTDVRLIRPMLSCDRAAVVSFLRDLDQPWREDHTNRDVTRLRARLRRDVLPLLHQSRPDAARKAVQFAQHMRSLHRLLNDAVEQVWTDHVRRDVDGSITIDRRPLRRIGEPVLYQLLRRLLIETDLGADTLTRRALMPIINAVCDRKGGRRRFELSENVQVMITRQMLRVGRDLSAP